MLHGRAHLSPFRPGLVMACLGVLAGVASGQHTTTRLSVNALGFEGNSPSYEIDISPDALESSFIHGVKHLPASFTPVAPRD